MKKNKWQTVLSAAFLIGPLAASAAALVIDSNGVLTGARDVNILGASYDVEFRVGLCSTFYGACGPGGNFGGMYQPPDAQRLEFAEQASWALLDQVLIGEYDLDAALTSGCVRNFFGRCYILTPYWWQNTQIGTAAGLVSMVAVNGSILPYDILHPYLVFSNDDMVLSSNRMGNRHPEGLTDSQLDPSSAGSVWAVWRLSSDAQPNGVPESDTLALLGIGLLGLAHQRRRFAAQLPVKPVANPAAAD